ncbi:MAG: hypothetical protein GY765_23450 [bacterium]|nr:hypothetical protein [bacterium]
MKLKFLLVFTVLFMLTIGLNAQILERDFPELMDDDLSFEEAFALKQGKVERVCEVVDNANYYLRYVYLYTRDHAVAGKVKLSIQRRNGEFTRLRVEMLCSRSYGWKLKASHLYVATQSPVNKDPNSFPYRQVSAPSKKHEYYVDLESLGTDFENVYIAIHAVMEKMIPGKYDEYPVGSVNDTWGFKVSAYPGMKYGKTLNPLGQPWGTFFPSGDKLWPAYFLVNIPYSKGVSWVDCPKPFYLIFKL